MILSERSKCLREDILNRTLVGTLCDNFVAHTKLIIVLDIEFNDDSIRTILKLTSLRHNAIRVKHISTRDIVLLIHSLGSFDISLICFDNLSHSIRHFTDLASTINFNILDYTSILRFNSNTTKIRYHIFISNTTKQSISIFFIKSILINNERITFLNRLSHLYHVIDIGSLRQCRSISHSNNTRCKGFRQILRNRGRVLEAFIIIHNCNLGKHT